MVTEPLIIVDSDFTIRVEVTPLNDDDDVDLCHTCLMKRLNTKPKRKYVRKEKEADQEGVWNQ
jgi:hypothetical protein